ncbi:McrC family protein [Actinomadura roseirufa]|uniref:McrC family protein n=1 Tax=Actinomadura roseirufa TaxID=2094049 RepID=UPI0010410C50|nr:restriction endonuclease [Actinomadura roseirufa]
MTVIRLHELDRGRSVPLAPEQGQRLARSEVVRAAPNPFDHSLWTIAPHGKVGAARVGDLEIHIAPKVPIARLLFLLGYAHHGDAWREESVALDEAATLVPAFAQALWRQTQRAIHQGLLPGYVDISETSYVLRGRLRETEQLHRHHGLAIPLEIRHDEFTVDIPENRILLTACERMLTVPGVDAQSARMLRHVLRDFADVSPLARRDPIPTWLPTRLNARYHTALRLAELVLRATSAEHGPGGVAINGFLLDMPQLFEDFVTAALRDALAPYGGRLRSQDPHFLDEAQQVNLKPDIVWYQGGAPVAVVDAKYKAEKPKGYPNADLYQLLAYCTVLGLPVGHLVYAKGNETPVRHIVRRSGTEILGHALDLDAEPSALLAQLGRLAGILHRCSVT